MEDNSEAKPVPTTANEVDVAAVPVREPVLVEAGADTSVEVGVVATANVHDHAETDAEDGVGDDSEDAATVGEGGTSEDGEAGAKKKRRRRRRRKKDGTGPAVEGVVALETREPKKRDVSNAPFGRFFAQAGKRHAFAVGEVVAGRVVAVADGAISVDLFGKAVAIAELNEPRDLPVEPTRVEAVAADAVPTVADTVLPVGDAGPAELPSVEAATDQGPEADVATEQDAATRSAIDAVMAEAEAALDEAASDEVETSAGAVEAPELPPDPEPLPELEPPALGQIFKGRIGAVAESGHIAIVNRIIDVPAARARVERYRQERRRVRGLVYGFNRGGFDVLVEGLRAFCPVSGMALGEIDDPNEYVAKHLEFSLPPAKPGMRARDIIVSRRTILEKQLRRAARDLVRTLQPGQRVTGRVTQVREFGAFVDLGGIEGLIHQTELTYNRGVRPDEVVSPGDVIEVQVLQVAVEPKKERRARISLSLKALQADPWQEQQELVAEGRVLTAKVTTVTDFGAFLEVAPGIEGLLHITELGRDLKHASQVLQVGDEVPVVIERADRGTRRISLSRLSPTELSEHEEGKLAEGATVKAVRQGDTVKVKVEKVEPRGVLVRVSGVVGRRGRGYLPASETGTERGADLRKQFPAGSEIEVKIVGTDRDGGLRCSVKALAVDEERKAIKDYRKAAAKQGFGTFGDLLRAKLDTSSK